MVYEAKLLLPILSLNGKTVKTLCKIFFCLKDNEWKYKNQRTKRKSNISRVQRQSPYFDNSRHHGQLKYNFLMLVTIYIYDF